MPQQQEQLTDEQVKALRSKKWRMNHLYKIKDKDGKLVTFKMNPAQEHFFNNMHTRNVILKSRQLGFTTFSCVYNLDEVLFPTWEKNPDTKKILYNVIDAIIIAQTKDDVEKIFDGKISLAWEHFDLKHWYGVDSETAKRLKFALSGFSEKSEVQGTLYASISVAQSGRSGTYQRIHVSEFGKIAKAFPDRAKEIITGTFRTAPANAVITVESTAEGDSGDFYTLYTEAKPNHQKDIHPKDWKQHFYNWQWDTMEIEKAQPTIPRAELPKEMQEYQILHKLTPEEITFYYRTWASADIGKDWHKMKQEYPTTPEEAFESSGEKLFKPHSLDKQLPHLNRTPEIQGNWRIFEGPKPNHIYGIGADPSEGVGQDHAAAAVIDFTPTLPRPKVVATFMDQDTPPDMLAHELKAKGILYNTANIIVERNNHGHLTLHTLRQMYPVSQIYKEVKDTHVDPNYTDRLGWSANVSTKSQVVFTFSTALDEYAIEITDPILYAELSSYPKDQVNQVRVKKDQTKHWDLSIATFLAYHLKDYLSQTKSITYVADYSDEWYTNGSGESDNEKQYGNRKAFDPYSPF